MATLEKNCLLFILKTGHTALWRNFANSGHTAVGSKISITLFPGNKGKLLIDGNIKGESEADGSTKNIEVSSIFHLGGLPAEKMEQEIVKRNLMVILIQRTVTIGGNITTICSL